jgi:hypothetical protein
MGIYEHKGGSKMKRITIKVEGIEELKKALTEKRNEVLDTGEKVIKEHMDKQLRAARSKIHNISGETANSLSAKVDLKGLSAIVARVGAFDSAEDAIRANSLEYGHAAPNNRGGAKIIPAHPFLRPALYEDEKIYKRDLREAIRRVIEGG